MSVTDINSKKAKQLQLTTDEMVRMENIQLKGQLIEMQYQQAKNAIKSSYDEFVSVVMERTGEDLSDYEINQQSGACILKEVING